MAAGDSPKFEGTFYSRINRESWLYQPRFVRTRHRYRGHRESEKVNLDINQIYADMSYLASEMNIAEDNLETDIDNVLNGKTYTDVTYTDEDATPTNELITLKSLDVFSGEMAALEQRIKRLYNG